MDDFGAFYSEHVGAVTAYVARRVERPEVVFDLVAETFARALERWHRFDPRRAGPRTWLCQLARSTALDHFRAEARRRRREGRYAATEPRERSLELRGQPFPEDLLRVVLELEGEAAARVLGISTTACSTRLSRALQKLEKEVSAGVAA